MCYPMVMNHSPVLGSVRWPRRFAPISALRCSARAGHLSQDKWLLPSFRANWRMTRKRGLQPRFGPSSHLHYSILRRFCRGGSLPFLNSLPAKRFPILSQSDLFCFWNSSAPVTINGCQRTPLGTASLSTMKQKKLFAPSFR